MPLCHLQVQMTYRIVPKFSNSIPPAWITHCFLAAQTYLSLKWPSKGKDTESIEGPNEPHLTLQLRGRKEVTNRKRRNLLLVIIREATVCSFLHLWLPPQSWWLFECCSFLEGVGSAWHQHGIHPNFLANNKPKALQISVSARSYCWSSLIFLFSHEKLSSRKNKQLGHHPPISLVWGNIKVSMFPYL